MNRPNRTFISSVLFLDIVGYTQLPVTEQTRLKEQFNALVPQLIADIPEADRMVLDTGDGAVLSFLGDPEDALFFAIQLRDAIAGKQAAGFPGLILRMGINLGPVKLLKDAGGRPSLIGDGINVAQRVMHFAEPGQILVSRSFYDVVTCLSDEYRTLFSHHGTHTDRQVREHELYEIGFVDPARSLTLSQRMQVGELPGRVPPEQAALLARALEPYLGGHAHMLVRARATRAKDFADLRQTLAGHVPDAQARAAFLAIEPDAALPTGRRKPWLIPAAIAGLLALIAGAWVMNNGPAPVPETAATAAGPASPAPTPVDTATSNAADIAGVAASAGPAVASASPPPPDTARDADEKNAKARAAKAEKKSAREHAADAKNARAAAPVTSATPPAAAPAAPDNSAARARTGLLRFQISGVAELYVDGARIGSSSTVTQYAVTPGEHRIQIRECGFPPDTKHQSVSVDANGSKLVVASC